MRSKKEMFWCEVLIKSVLVFAPTDSTGTNTAPLLASSERTKAQQKAGMPSTTLPSNIDIDRGAWGHVDTAIVLQKMLHRGVRLKATRCKQSASFRLSSRRQRLEVGSKLIPWKLAAFCVGIACTNTTDALFLENHYAVAASCDVNAVSLSGSVADPNQLDLRSHGDTLLDRHQQQSSAKQPAASCVPLSKPELAPNSFPQWAHETSLQAQSSTTSPATPQTSPANPNQERFLQPPPLPAPVPQNSQPSVQPPPTPAPVQPPSTPAPQTTPNPQTIQVQRIEVTGSTIFGTNQLAPIVRPYEGRPLTLDQLNEVAAKITQLYLNQGYITSRAILVDQAVTNGVVQIRVIEGGIEEIRIEGARRVNPNYIRSRIKLGARTPVSTAKLEDQLRLLRADPLFANVEASLRAGTRLGQSILIVRVTEANPFSGSVGIDNYSPPSVGSERLGANALYRNLTGNGDALAGSYYHTTQGGSDTFEFSYRLPVNPMNGAIQLRTLITNNKIIDPNLTFADIQGDSQLYEISFQQPLVRTPREEFALSVGFTAQNSKSESIAFPGIFISPGADSRGYTDTRVFKFGQDYVRRDVSGAWSMRSLFSFGADFLGATLHPHPTPDGRFFSWLGQVQRVQILNNNNLLIMGADVQLTPDSLVPSQQFVIGGGQSLRGYRQNIRAGDNGVRFTLEDRITLERNEGGSPTFQFAPFFDAGYVWNVDDNPTNKFLPSQRFLAGIGFGILWQPEPQLDIRFDYAYPLIDLKDRGENAQDNGIYFSVRYLF